MEKQEQQQDVEQVIRVSIQELLDKMGFRGEIETIKGNELEENVLVFNIKTNEPTYLIGQYGSNLQSLQHIARILARKKVLEKTNFILDVNSYQQEKGGVVIKLAKEAAERCLLEKRAIVLRPMTAYERRLVHMELSKRDDVTTESVGDGEGRKVMVRPVGLV